MVVFITTTLRCLAGVRKGALRLEAHPRARKSVGLPRKLAGPPPLGSIPAGGILPRKVST